MKLALVTDTHFGARGDSQVFQDHFGRFYSEVFFPYLDENNIKNVVHLGDAFDRRKYTNHLTLQKAKECFYEPLAVREIALTAIVGNHDAYYRNKLTPNTIGLFAHESYDYVDLIDRPTWRTFDNLKVALIPWICEENQGEVSGVLFDKAERARVVFGHLELKGFEMYRGMPSAEGADVGQFLGFEKVLSGHFHHRHTKNNITYLGCPYEITWADYGDPKGFHVLDTETLELEFVENPHTIFAKVILDDLSPPVDPESLAGKIVRVTRAGGDDAWFWSCVKEIELHASSVQVINTPAEALDSPEEMTEAEDMLSLIRRYIDESDAKVDKASLFSLMSELYHEAVT